MLCTVGKGMPSFSFSGKDEGKSLDIAVAGQDAKLSGWIVI